MWLSEIAQQIGGQLEGPDRFVARLAAPDRAGPGDLVVVREARYLEAALASGAALILDKASPCPDTLSRIRVPEVRKAWPRVLALFDQPETWADGGVHPTATIEAGAQVDSTASVGAYALVCRGARIGAGVVIAPFCYVGAGVEIGPQTVLEPRVTLYPHTRLGAGCRIGAGTVLGVVGFGFQDDRRLPHTGKVVLEDGVELGANCVVQRSVVGETRIGAASKIGDLTSIGHNVQIGKGVVMVGSSAIGGSAVVEDGVLMGGWVVLSDHVRVGRGARITGSSAISKNVPAGETWAGAVPAQPSRKHWRRLAFLDWLVTMERILRQFFKPTQP
ncbi:MAG: UDP-3-O-(3-hydroxymyristoyl)glucosamine N-acyltransferase [Meiothermus sp.]|uniref:UDP-3-O-(3-hydroxymyristoyl)glucosamine N-acyltransferase n=1 Tax=Meiothermus sp. TaxID=1955249 RepID=UPI0025DF516F|nr:UDP-3-O-(3-hydroxymyristoyl)glucosamine N-acyltransferase [Meiothermus sp.]MCS7069451.1 UDP-3-O-(3-hydroxymyristoyl)glucosamine N-acyltransferase [Meiothermus sp.]MCX7601284.1 UDP-3-O-(3-hydroxymyristoyl)glucosamine N-acyltransferase [Meiothermus sp.]MDW8424866.1 UDP-3-O-(3-hydroxymyristoyl)glucosamine N-acyltransferase [Meiothermus sp.]